MKKTAFQEASADFLLAWLFAFSLLWGAFHSMQYQFPTGRMALFVFAFALAVVLILRVPYVFFAVCLLFLLFVLFWEIPTFRDPARMRILIADWEGFASWAYESLTRNVPGPPQEYLDRALLLLSLGAALVSGLLVRVRTHPAAFLLAGGGLFLVQEVYLDKLFLPAFLLYLFSLTLYTLRQSYAGRRKRVHKAAAPLRFLAGTVPLCLLAVGLAVLLPSRETPLGQPVLDWIGGWNAMGDEGPVSLEIGSFTFGGLKKRDADNELGGALRRNNTLLFRVRAERSGYLRAHVYDDYTGRSWQSNDEAFEDYFKMGTYDAHAYSDGETTLFLRVKLPTLSTGFPLSHGTLAGGYQLLNGAIMRAVAEERTPPLDKLFREQEEARRIWAEDLSSSGVGDLPDGPLLFLIPQPDRVFFHEQEITFVNIRTAALFLPLEAVDLTLSPSGASESTPAVERSTHGEMRMGRAQSKGFGYTVETCDLGLTRGELGDLLRQGTPEILLDAPADDGFMAYSMRDYARWDASLAGRYTVLPADLPDRVTELARDLTDGLPTDFDKALAVETYLRTSFPYDLNVPGTPPGRDFVDYFLFDLQRGYCTYYATAMTVLCRAAGLPARYVEGFAPEPDASNPGQYVVTGEQAHAWCEVFFPGFGWITFEPTAAFGISFDESYAASATSEPASTPAPNAAPPPVPTPDAGAEGSEAAGGPTLPGFLWALLAALAVMGGCPALQAVRRRRLKRGVGDPGRAVDRLFACSVGLARRLGVSAPAPAETPLDWARRADQSLGAPADASFFPVSERYGRLRYGPEAPTAKDVKALYRLQENLSSRWKQAIPRTKYLFYRYYLGWM